MAADHAGPSRVPARSGRRVDPEPGALRGSGDGRRLAPAVGRPGRPSPRGTAPARRRRRGRRPAGGRGAVRPRRLAGRGPGRTSARRASPRSRTSARSCSPPPAGRRRRRGGSTCSTRPPRGPGSAEDRAALTRASSRTEPAGCRVSPHPPRPVRPSVTRAGRSGQPSGGQLETGGCARRKRSARRASRATKIQARASTRPWTPTSVARQTLGEAIHDPTQQMPRPRLPTS